MNKKILIVEDEPALLSVLVDNFSNAGYDVLQAKDGQEGLIKSMENHPDIILLDMIMPVMDGVSMLKKLREDDWGRNAEVVLLTNLTDMDKKSDETTKNCDFMIKSNLRIDEVVDTITRKLNKLKSE